MTLYQFITSFCISLIALSCSSEDNAVPVAEDEVANNVECLGTESTFSINLNATDCSVDLGIESSYQETVSSGNRNITINNIPDHLVGSFPNPGNPNTISEMGSTYSITMNPQISGNTVTSQGFEFGVLFSGVTIDPYTAEFFIGSAGVNMDWNITSLTTAVNLGLDCNNAHVQPTGKYHYHGTPTAYAADLQINGEEMVKVGYAADGFPIYYKYGYNEEGSSIISLESGYRLKEGSRGGDGTSAPDGCFDGTYFQDYEYVEGVSLLDECNGRFGKTPENETEYYYVITDNFPSSPLCFKGSPSQDFRIF